MSSTTSSPLVTTTENESINSSTIDFESILSSLSFLEQESQTLSVSQLSLDALSKRILTLEQSITCDAQSPLQPLLLPSMNPSFTYTTVPSSITHNAMSPISTFSTRKERDRNEKEINPSSLLLCFSDLAQAYHALEDDSMRSFLSLLTTFEPFLSHTLSQTLTLTQTLHLQDTQNNTVSGVLQNASLKEAIILSESERLEGVVQTLTQISSLLPLLDRGPRTYSSSSSLSFNTTPLSFLELALRYQRDVEKLHNSVSDLDSDMDKWVSLYDQMIDSINQWFVKIDRKLAQWEEKVTNLEQAKAGKHSR